MFFLLLIFACFGHTWILVNSWYIFCVHIFVLLFLGTLFCHLEIMDLGCRDFVISGCRDLGCRDIVVLVYSEYLPWNGIFGVCVFLGVYILLVLDYGESW